MKGARKWESEAAKLRDRAAKARGRARGRLDKARRARTPQTRERYLADADKAWGHARELLRRARAIEAFPQVRQARSLRNRPMPERAEPETVKRRERPERVAVQTDQQVRADGTPDPYSYAILDLSTPFGRMYARGQLEGGADNGRERETVARRRFAAGCLLAHDHAMAFGGNMGSMKTEHVDSSDPGTAGVEARIEAQRHIRRAFEALDRNEYVWSILTQLVLGQETLRSMSRGGRAYSSMLEAIQGALDRLVEVYDHRLNRMTPPATQHGRRAQELDPDIFVDERRREPWESWRVGAVNRG